MLSFDGSFKLSYIKKWFVCKKLKTKCKAKYKTNVDISCESNVECDCNETKSYQKYYGNSSIYVAIAFPTKF